MLVIEIKAYWKMTRYESKCLCTSLRKASRRVTRLYDMALAPSGLKVTQYALLKQIQRCGPVAVGELAEAQVMDAGGLAHTLKPLERDGYIAQSVDPNDRRSRLVTLTPLGEAKVKETSALWDQIHVNFEAVLGADKSAPLREALRFLVSEEFAAAFEKSQAG
jgi:DNA-binding MarR family transcriptional regulator